MFNTPKGFLLSGPLVDGLPVPENTSIVAELKPDKFIIKAITNINPNDIKIFELTLEKVQNVQLLQKKETKEVTEQSATGMIIGAALFGNLGASVGGRVRTKEKVTYHTHFVIDYMSDVPKQIIIDVSYDLLRSEKVVKRFKELRPDTNTATNTVVQL